MEGTDVKTMPEQLRSLCEDGKALEAANPGWECKLFYSAWANYLARENGGRAVSLFVLGLNPGGRPGQQYDALNGGDPSRPGFSAYLHERWNERSEKGEALPQKRVQSIINSLASGRGEALLGQVPAGNLIPFRTRDAAALHSNRAMIREGVTLGLRLLELVRPAVILCFGNQVTRDRRGVSTLEMLLNQHPESWSSLEEIRCEGEAARETRYVRHARIHLWDKDTWVVGLPHFSYPFPVSVCTEVEARAKDVLRHASVDLESTMET